MDYKGTLLLKDVPSPLPGETLNITMISRIERQMFYDGRNDYHRPLAIKSHQVEHHEDGPVKIDFCHDREMVGNKISKEIFLHCSYE